MGLGVVSDDPHDNDALLAETPQGDKTQGTALALHAAGLDQAALAPLVERLEALSFTFEALNASSRTYAAEAVLETLGRMERRDLQALAAIEAFASALKTVGQHLAGLRNALQGTAHDTAHGFQLLTERLDQMEARLGAGQALTGPQGGQLTVIAERLGHIEEMMGNAEPFDSSPLTQILETMVHKVERVEEKVDELPEQVAKAVDMAPVATNLETIAERMANVERKIDEAKPVDVTPLRLALDVISKRVARIESRMEQAPGQVQGVDTNSINQVIEAISSRIGTMEERVSSAGSVEALSGFLDMVNQRLERMEANMGQAKPLPPGIRVSATPRPQPQPQPQPQAAPPAAEPPPPASVQAPALPKQQVDNLLEQVLKVLSR